ncbi:hypothetical protein FRC04_012112 [Tulasnella sp. 424]|nr:hypothetical protein FRC04_012112 [Tulasnella sp. 424]KAG8971077.1 hypothetical protein FRC05_011543 [Tulasnella sp. 425]
MSSGSTPPPGANYPRTSTYLQLVREKIPNNVDFIRLFSLVSYLNTYITTNNPNDLRSETLRTPFIAVMEEVKRMKEVFEADEPLKDAYVLFEAEMVHVLGQVKIREDEAKAKKRWLAAAAGGALLTVGTVVVGPALAVGGLKLIGFRSVGPLAGSIAARIQSAVYGGAVRSRSIFALCQSAVMGGIAVGNATENIAAGVAALGAGAGLLGSLGGSDNDDGDDAGSNEAESNNGQVH